MQEIIDLPEGCQEVLWKEVASALRVIQKVFTVDKLNVSAVGNIVRRCPCRRKAKISFAISCHRAPWSPYLAV